MANKNKSEGAFEGVPMPEIYSIRGEAVVLDEDVAALFDVETKRLNEQVGRNEEKFGEDFAFRLTKEEWTDLKSQIATPSEDTKPAHGGRRTPPRAFTEHGVVMAATVLKSERAAQASRFIVKTFIAARKTKLAKVEGQNLPAKIDPRDVMPLAGDARHGLMAKLDAALGRVLDAIADPDTGTTVRDEAQAIAQEGLKAIKSHLKKQGVANEKSLAEIRKLLKEADLIQSEIEAKTIENEHRRLALVAKQLRVVLEVQRYLETGSVEGLLSVLQEMGGA